MKNIPYQLSDTTLTIFINGTPHIIHRDNSAFDNVMATLNDETLSTEETVEIISKLLNPIEILTDVIDGDRVTIEGNRVLFDGEMIPTSLSRKLLHIAQNGLPIEPWKRFVARVFANPSRGAQAELNEFLEQANLPITEDGCFLAYKRVREDYKDVYSGKFDNSVGSICEMPRTDVDSDRDNTCSNGLHFCSQDYLKNFYSGAGRIVIVKVNPSDVVSIPSDYNFTKGRTCRYEVVGEVDLSTESAKQEWGIYDEEFTLFEIFDEDWDDPLDWYDDEDDSDQEDVVEYVHIIEPAIGSIDDDSFETQRRNRLRYLREKFRRN